jgi:hypothetical protein
MRTIKIKIATINITTKLKAIRIKLFEIIV